MTPKAREALEASIEHWRENVEAEVPEEASVSERHCALCQAFPREDCRGCPVAAVAAPRCLFTPYDEACFAIIRWRDGIGTQEEWRAAAKKELEFLESLREEERR